MEWHIACKFWRKFSKSSNLLENFLLVYLSHPIPVFFPAFQSNDHSCVFPVFCNPLFYTYIPVRIICFLYSSVFVILVIQRIPKQVWYFRAPICLCSILPPFQIIGRFDFGQI